MEEWIPRIFKIIICLSAVNVFGRPDYNLPLFIFSLLIWDYPQSQKVKITYILIYSFVIDFIYLLFWGLIWETDIYKTQAFDNSIHQLVIFISLIIFIMKILLIVVIIWKIPEAKSNLHFEAIKENTIKFFTCQN